MSSNGEEVVQEKISYVVDYAKTKSWRKGGNVQVGQVKLFGGPQRNIIPKSLS